MDLVSCCFYFFVKNMRNAIIFLYLQAGGRIMATWADDTLFYHIYPLGCFGCEQFAITQTQHRILELKNWIPHLKKLHVHAVYLGPVFSSYEHGYDTSDYQIIDSRLGTNEDFKEVCDALHDANIKIVLDGVFNHVGRSFWAFQDVQQHQQASVYCDWFQNLNFHTQSPLQDNFTYDAWEGHYNLIKLNLGNEHVVNYLLESIAMWIDYFKIDGLRLDAADCIRPEFFQTLKQFCKTKKSDFWLMGEIIHGDYTRWANPNMLDSVTNYECYKGLYSSHNEKNYFEIAHSIQRQFGNGGIYKDLMLYSFVDNHDVNRLASVIKHQEDLCNVYTLMYAMPGIPSIYYGSEFAFKGMKHDGSDADIRPSLNIHEVIDQPLSNHLYTLGEIYEQHPVMHTGSYQQVLVKNEQFVFARTDSNETLYAAFNICDQAIEVEFPCIYTSVEDVLNKQSFEANDGKLTIELPPHGSRILVPCSCHHINLHKEPCSTKKPTKDACDIFVQNLVENRIKLGKYRHFKGKEYAVLYVAKHSETLEEYVVYRQLYGDEGIWIRPLSMFCEVIERDGKTYPRFEYLGK